jgi:5-methylcytosine-specific restriction enzyme A
MAFICEDVGTTRRRRMTQTRALQAWERHKGICVNCNVLIDGVRDDWFVEHIRALELGGADENENLGPAHYACKSGKDAADHSAAAQAKRQKANHLGIKDPSRRKIAKPARAPKRLSKQLPSRRPIYEDAP